MRKRKRDKVYYPNLVITSHRDKTASVSFVLSSGKHLCFYPGLPDLIVGRIRQRFATLLLGMDLADLAVWQHSERVRLEVEKDNRRARGRRRP